MNKENEKTIKSIEKTNVKKDDVLIITIRDSYSGQVPQLAENLRRLFPENKILFIKDGINIEIYTPKKED